MEKPVAGEIAAGVQAVGERMTELGELAAAMVAELLVMRVEDCCFPAPCNWRGAARAHCRRKPAPRGARQWLVRQSCWLPASR